MHLQLAGSRGRGQGGGPPPGSQSGRGSPAPSELRGEGSQGPSPAGCDSSLSSAAPPPPPGMPSASPCTLTRVLPSAVTWISQVPVCGGSLMLTIQNCPKRRVWPRGPWPSSWPWEAPGWERRASCHGKHFLPFVYRPQSPVLPSARARARKHLLGSGSGSCGPPRGCGRSPSGAVRPQ